LPIFDPAWLAPLRRPDWVYEVDERNPRTHQQFWIGIDPAGKGFSRTVICSFLFDRSNHPPGLDYRVIILAAEILPGKTINSYELGKSTIEHVKHVRASIPGLRNAYATVCVENNSIMVADSLRVAIERTPGAAGLSGNIGLVYEEVARGRGRGGHGAGAEPMFDLRAGTHTTNKSKEEIMRKLRALLLEGGLQFHSHFTVPHPERQPPGESSPEDAKRLFVDEIANIHGEIIRSTGPRAGHKRPTIKYCGFTVDGQRANDDKAMALGFALQCYSLTLIAPHLVIDCVAEAR
jgi:hypothetical protein